MVRHVSLAAAFWLIALSIVAAAQEAGPLRVLRYDTEEPVSAIVVHGRFLDGNQLRDLYEMLGVPDEVLESETDDAARELFIFLRIESTKAAGGVPAEVELQIANESPVLSHHERIVKAPLLLNGPYIVVRKLVGYSDSRSGAFDGYGPPAPPDRGTTDHVEKLRRQLPLLRLKAMVIK